MTNQHPITPPPELVEQWLSEHYGTPTEERKRLIGGLATEAAQWGADQELEACLWHLESTRCNQIVITTLRAARRPKPPSLKEQALALVTHDFSDQPCLSKEGYALIRRAL